MMVTPFEPVFPLRSLSGAVMTRTPHSQLHSHSADAYLVAYQNLNWKVTKYSLFVDVSLTTKMAFIVDALEFFG